MLYLNKVVSKLCQRVLVVLKFPIVPY